MFAGTSTDQAEMARQAAVIAEQSRLLSGLDLVRAIVAGDIPPPPLARAIGMRFVEAEAGRVVVELIPSELHYNLSGSMHGGVYSLLLDSAAGTSVQSMLPVRVGSTRLDLTVKFLRAVTAASAKDGPLRCTGTVTHLGRRTGLAEARLLDGHGRLCATAVSSVLILPRQAPDADPDRA